MPTLYTTVLRVTTSIQASCARYTVPFNYNFIFTRVNTRGTTRNVHSIPVTCLRGPRFLVACVVYFITGTTRVKQLLSLHAWNKPRVHSHV